MGRFFVNFQVRVPTPVDEALPPLERRVREQLQAAGFEPALDEGPSLRRIAVARTPGGRWRTVLDSRSGSQDPDAVDDTGVLLSRASGQPVLALVVHDDDFLEMKLFSDGRRVSALSSWPGYFEGRPRAAPDGDFEAWANVLAADRTPAQWRQAWQPQEPPGDIRPLLQRVAAAIGLDLAQAMLGQDMAVDMAGPEFATQAFRRTDERAPSAAVERTPGLGHLGGLAGRIVLPVGARMQIEAIAHSSGAGGTGLTVLAWGKVLDAGLVAVRGATLALGVQAPVALRLQDTPAHEGRLLSASLPSLKLPPGFAGPAEAFAQAGQSASTGLDLWLSSRVALALELEVIGAGQGELQLAVQLSDQPDVLAHWRTQLTARPANQ